MSLTDYPVSDTYTGGFRSPLFGHLGLCPDGGRLDRIYSALCPTVCVAPSALLAAQFRRRGGVQRRRRFRVPAAEEGVHRVVNYTLPLGPGEHVHKCGRRCPLPKPSSFPIADPGCLVRRDALGGTATVHARLCAHTQCIRLLR